MHIDVRTKFDVNDTVYSITNGMVVRRKIAQITFVSEMSWFSKEQEIEEVYQIYPLARPDWKNDPRYYERRRKDQLFNSESEANEALLKSKL